MLQQSLHHDSNTSPDSVAFTSLIRFKTSLDNIDFRLLC